MSPFSYPRAQSYSQLCLHYARMIRNGLVNYLMVTEHSNPLTLRPDCLFVIACSTYLTAVTDSQSWHKASHVVRREAVCLLDFLISSQGLGSTSCAARHIMLYVYTV